MSIAHLSFGICLNLCIYNCSNFAGVFVRAQQCTLVDDETSSNHGSETGAGASPGHSPAKEKSPTVRVLRFLLVVLSLVSNETGLGLLVIYFGA